MCHYHNVGREGTGCGGWSLQDTWWVGPTGYTVGGSLNGPWSGLSLVLERIGRGGGGGGGVIARPAKPFGGGAMLHIKNLPHVTIRSKGVFIFTPDLMF